MKDIVDCFFPSADSIDLMRSTVESVIMGYYFIGGRFSDMNIFGVNAQGTRSALNHFRVQPLAHFCAAMRQ